MWRTAATAVAAVALVAGTVTPAAARTGFQECGDGLWCASLTVPADWARPDGARISLGIAKVPARERRRGSVVVNLGGPGEQIAHLPHVKDALEDLSRSFDVVLADPRGFGRSSGVRCPSPSPQRAEWVFDDREEFDRYRAANRGFGARCVAAAGPLAGKLDSWQVARDLEAVRVALGERRLNYFGNSYGTVFGQAYAESFPHRVGRFYLDSAFDHTERSVVDWVGERAAADERNLHRMAAWCAEDARCALHGRDVVGVWAEVLARAPIPTSSGGSVSAARIVSRAFLDGPQDWAELARALAEALGGDAGRFAVDSGARDPDLSRVVLCADFRYPSEFGRLRELESRVRRDAPLVGWRQTWVIANHCAGLPVPTTFPQHPFRADVRALVVNGDHDPVTPPAYGRRVASRLAHARYLSVPSGHAVYLSGNPCVREHVNRYFATGVLPAAGTACPGD
ncbi:alpha/beta hydrolase [Saccharothrix algeriensis]|uniref:Alpha/beta fold hydrolase n=1 Tax=Saccharothrix algeriensis TaxID=173560 RepID=A0A8T8HVP2_9PSEU|nr:alpha/beta hydrolase [Saccharothrix algeriensis]MBM7814179.1 pimeloyl-ACP methyl ester carboxylesterase [Saccharothrix algeriensis]QTR02546.1 alpha/beta fold hydrolase [Saccharothrix algeriensis]